jgi:[ribosomal protein S18]-alanine N-acetyltransferase
LIRIVQMKSTHIPACQEITSASEPWKSLHEQIEFKRYIPLKQAYVCIDAIRVVGFIIFTPEPVFARGGYLRAIGVAADMRRQGIGGKLMDFAESRTAQRSQYFYLCVSSFNKKAQSFYKKLGYRKVGELPGLIMPGATEFIYWKRLANSLPLRG